MLGVLSMLLNRSGPARSRAVPLMLMRAVPCSRVKQGRSEVVFGFGRLVLLDERGLEEVQAHGSLVCDSFGAELTVMRIFGRMYLSSMHAAPEGCL